MLTQLFIIDLEQLQAQHKSKATCVSLCSLFQFSQREENILCFCKGHESTKNDSKPIQRAMLFFKSRVGLLFMAAFVVCFDFHSISALVRKTDDGFRGEDEGTVEDPQPIQGKRTVQTNAALPNLTDIEKRLLAVEKK